MDERKTPYHDGDRVVLDIGDKVHIFTSWSKGETVEGTVIHQFDIQDHMYGPMNVISLPNSIEDIYEVRSSHILEVSINPIKDDNMPDYSYEEEAE